MIAFILANWRWLLPSIAIAILALLTFERGIIIHDQAAKIDALKIESKSYKDAAEKNSAEAADAIAREKKNLEVILKMQSALVERERKAKQRQKEILNVAKDKDGGIAPVSVDSLNRLRE